MSDPLENVSQPTVIMWAEYPDGRYQAAVQSDNRAIYFVVQKNADPTASRTSSDGTVDGTTSGDSSASTVAQSPRLVWVRNLVPAPMIFSQKPDDAFTPPLLPESYCAHPKGAATLDLQQTRILWFEQGIGAALVEGDRILALIPPIDAAGMPGYAADCLHSSPVSLPLDDDDVYSALVPGLEDYWQQWGQGTVLSQWQVHLIPKYEHALGTISQVFTSQNDTWPPIMIAEIQAPTCTQLLTLGTALRCQPSVEKDLQNFAQHQRIELAITLTPNQAKEQLADYMQWLLGMARYPWHYGTCFLPSHTVIAPFSNADDQDPDVHQRREMFTLATETHTAKSLGRDAIAMPSFRDQPVNLLWFEQP